MRVYDASTRISAEVGGIRDLSQQLSLNFSNLKEEVECDGVPGEDEEEGGEGDDGGHGGGAAADAARAASRTGQRGAAAAAAAADAAAGSRSREADAEGFFT